MIEGGAEVRGPRGDAKHASTGSVEKAGVVAAGAGVKNFYAFDGGGFLQSGDALAGLERAGISLGGDDHAGGGVGRPLEIAVADPAFDGSFERFEQIAFQAHEHRLGFGIAEAAVKFQHHGAAGGEHESAIKHAPKLGAFGLHAGNRRTRYVGQQPLAHLRV